MFSSVATLKLPNRIKFSLSVWTLTNTMLKVFRREMILSPCALFEQPRSHFLFLKFNSMNRPPNELLIVNPLMHLIEISSLTYKKIPTPFTVWSRR